MELASMQITTESVAKALLPPPVASHYRVMGAVCATATVLTLCSNVLYMLRGWEEPLPFYDWSSNGIRWMTSQIWYAIGMIFLFHVVTRPAQSGVVLFGKFPMDLWSNKWNLCILYLPVRYLLLELCDFHRENKHILIPLEIVVDVVLYNGPFLVILLRLLYLAWKVAYDEAVLTGAIVESDNDINDFSLGSLFSRRGRSSSSSRDGYVGLAMEDLDDAELGQSQHSSEITASGTSSSVKSTKSEHNENGVTSSYKGSSNGSRSHSPTNKNYHHSSSLNTPPKPHSPKMSPRSSPRTSPRTSPKASSPLRNVIFSMDTSSEDEDDGNHYIGRELLQREARRLESRSLA
ncbi:hypothetical protein BGW38_010696 [Lunasporangiospora selenospora]|uniref:Uncharacterized protein n=1 Tax=Lunasporangiospora selenospora TaxID=979761 RepID=A0A9P6KFJ4_9FUNG|nr:hypothetical protein BGW38_010696 [Lunasporangiospora selenospora]